MLTSSLFSPLWDLVAFVHSNAWSITACLLVGYLVKSNVIDPYMDDYRRKKSYREATNPDRVSLLQQDMRRVRAAQQEESQQKSSEAKEMAEAKRLEEMKKKRVEQPNKGRKLGSRSTNESDGGDNPWTGSAGGGYSAMNPSSGHVGGYRATRRNPRSS